MVAVWSKVTQQLIANFWLVIKLQLLGSCIITHVHRSRVSSKVISQGHADYRYEACGHLRVMVASNYVSAVL